MFGMIESLTKSVVAVAVTPVTVVADIVTLGGALTDEKKPYTAQTLEKAWDNLDDAIDPKGCKK